MGESCKEACVTSLVIRCNTRSTVENHRMHIFVALFYVSLVAAPGCSSLPTKEDSIRNTREHIITIVEITLVHIQKLREIVGVTPDIEINTPSINGLTTISHDLGLLANALQTPLTDLLTQIQADVSSLEGIVRFLALTVNCPIRPKPTAAATDMRFPETQLHLTLVKVKHYLEKLLLHKDKLEVC